MKRDNSEQARKASRRSLITTALPRTTLFNSRPGGNAAKASRRSKVFCQSVPLAILLFLCQASSHAQSRDCNDVLLMTCSRFASAIKASNSLIASANNCCLVRAGVADLSRRQRRPLAFPPNWFPRNLCRPSCQL